MGKELVRELSAGDERGWRLEWRVCGVLLALVWY